MLRELRHIEFESSNEGLSDLESLVALLRDREEVDFLFQSYGEALQAVRAGAEKYINGEIADASILDVVGEFRTRSKEVNHQFLKLTMQRYVDIIEEGAAAPASSIGSRVKTGTVNRAAL